jgi:hypothetical protein
VASVILSTIVSLEAGYSIFRIFSPRRHRGKKCFPLDLNGVLSIGVSIWPAFSFFIFFVVSV